MGVPIPEIIVFLSTPSARRATLLGLPVDGIFGKFLSTPSARRATGAKALWDKGVFISIHALREEGDRIMMQHHKPNI